MASMLTKAGEKLLNELEEEWAKQQATDTLDAGPPVIVTTVEPDPAVALGEAAGALVGRAWRSCYDEVSTILEPQSAAQVALQLMSIACSPDVLARAKERE